MRILKWMISNFTFFVLFNLLYKVVGFEHQHNGYKSSVSEDTNKMSIKSNEDILNAPPDDRDNAAAGGRQKRDSGTNPFDLIAGISGGSVIHTDKDNISSAIDLLTSRMVNQVVILRKQVKVNGTTRFSFYLDETVKEIGLKTATECCTPYITVQDPKGTNFTKSSANVTIKVDTTTTLYELINGTLLTGEWVVIIDDSKKQDYDVTVYGSSLISFNLDFCDSRGNTVSGQPISDSKETYVKVSPSGFDLTSNWTYFILKTINGTQLQQLPFGRIQGSRTSRAFLLQVTWPNMDVHVAVQGLDKSGHVFTRELPSLIQPLGIRVVLDNSDIGYITSCEIPTKLSFTVTNLLSVNENISCQVSSSNSKFEATVTSDHLTVRSLQTINVTASLTVTSSPSLGESTDIFITVLNSEKKAQYVKKTFIARNVHCKIDNHSIVGKEVTTERYDVSHTTRETMSTTESSGARCLLSTTSVLFIMHLLLNII
ncbi:von Willebrand factor (vWF) type A domain [Mactra antiquata]